MLAHAMECLAALHVPVAKIPSRHELLHAVVVVYKQIELDLFVLSSLTRSFVLVSLVVVFRALDFVFLESYAVSQVVWHV